MAMLRNEWVSLIFRVILGAIFIYASLDKIVHPEAFAKLVNNYHLAPSSMVNLIALFLPWLELFVGMALILGCKIEGASAIVTGMLCVFIVAVAISMARGFNIDCGCFSTSGRARSIGMTVILQDLGMLVCSVYVMAYGAGRWALDKKTV